MSIVFLLRRRAAALIGPVSIAMAVHPATAAEATTVSPAGDPWRVIESVLTHPRCINCHTVTDYPRQGDDRHVHQFRVVRGPDDRGAAGASCAACHQEDNQASSGVP